MPSPETAQPDKRPIALTSMSHPHCTSAPQVHRISNLQNVNIIHPNHLLSAMSAINVLLLLMQKLLTPRQVQQLAKPCTSCAAQGHHLLQFVGRKATITSIHASRAHPSTNPFLFLSSSALFNFFSRN